MGEVIPDDCLKEKSDQVLFDVISGLLGNDKGYIPNPVNCEKVLELENVKKIYEETGAKTAAINGISLEVTRGSFVGIMGASGSGKSTLLNMIATIDKPSSGTIKIDGQDVSGLTEEKLADFRRQHLGFIFQEYNLLDTLTIYENIALALTIKETPKKEIRTAVGKIAEEGSYVP